MADDDSFQTLLNAARDGAPDATYRLASALVARQQVEEAFALHHRAASAGHLGAQLELARMLLYGVGTPGGEADPAQAVHWLQQAEATGNPVAAYLLAVVGLGGVALPRDNRINERLGHAVRAGYPPALRAAAIHFGRKPHAEDQALCLQLLEHAASLGDTIAGTLLAARLEGGEGCAPDPDAAAAVRARMGDEGDFRFPAISAPPPVQSPGPARQLAIEDVFDPPPQVVLSERPRVATVDGLLSRDECRLLIAALQPELRESQAVDPDTGLPVKVPIRTSSDANLHPILEDFALRTVQLRLCAAAAVDLPHAEHLVVLRYAPGQEYRPHRDYLPPGTIERDHPGAGNRARTICVYLNDVEAGGATEFPVAGVTVAPRAGTAVVFDNLRADASPDSDSLHAGLPVERGVKWLATLWLRQGRYRDF